MIGLMAKTFIHIPFRQDVTRRNRNVWLPMYVFRMSEHWLCFVILMFDKTLMFTLLIGWLNRLISSTHCWISLSIIVHGTDKPRFICFYSNEMQSNTEKKTFWWKYNSVAPSSKRLCVFALSEGIFYRLLIHEFRL